MSLEIWNIGSEIIAVGRGVASPSSYKGFSAKQSFAARQVRQARAQPAELPQYRIPVILLARLAVDQKEAGKGLGKGLLKDALLRTVQAADIAGLRAMLTHAKDEDAKQFYLKYGFEASPVQPLTLMLSIKDIRASLL